MSVTKLTNDNIETIDVSKLTGSFPAIDGSSITGIVGGTTVMKAASDPANDTNPADGVGTMYLNTTTGNMFICIDATTDQNEWNNVGPGTGGVAYVPPLPFGGTGGGTISGYTSGGHTGVSSNIIDKFSVVNTGNAVDVGDLSNATHYGSGHSSSTHGYHAGGTGPYTKIQKFSFVSGSCSIIGDFQTGRTGPSAASSSTHGYSMGGYPNYQPLLSSIEKLSFSSNGDGSVVGQLTNILYTGSGQSSNTAGYNSGGSGTGLNNYVEKFLFATDGNTVNVGNLTNGGSTYTSGQSSITHGYICAGNSGTGGASMEKFSFDTDGHTVNVANLTTSRYSVTGQSSTTHGYVSGGFQGGRSNVIESFTFSVDASGVDHGDLTFASEQVTGHQY